MEQNADIQKLTERIEAESAFVEQIQSGMHERIVGQEALVRSLLVGLLSGGHILLEGVPGLAKTLAVKTLAGLVRADFSRIQFTPDLLPADVVGTLVYSQRSETFNVRRGPVFAHFVLADEINRAPAKVQSALLEAMEERQVTIGEETMPLPEPFLVLATQNPIEQEGTYPLPEAQVDRFMLKVKVGYPSMEEEQTIVRQHLAGTALAAVRPVVDTKAVLAARSLAASIYVDERIENYIVRLVAATRRPSKSGLRELDKYIALGASPRGGINLAVAARTLAFLSRRGYVLPEDVRAMAPDVLRHRIALTYEAEADRVDADKIIAEILARVQVP